MDVAYKRVYSWCLIIDAEGGKSFSAASHCVSYVHWYCAQIAIGIARLVNSCIVIACACILLYT